MQTLRNKHFWLPFLLTTLALGTLFVWELGLLPSAPPRPHATWSEILFAIVLDVLIALNAGLLSVRKKNESCPVGAKRATGIAGVLGATALICSACTLLPLTLFGASISLAFLTPFLPLLRIIALLLAVVGVFLLWPRVRNEEGGNRN